MNRETAVTLTIAALILGLWGCSWYFLGPLSNEERGTFGDMFGAVNALFSGFAFLGVIYAILLQRNELALQREELELTRRELKKAADAQEKSEKALAVQAKAMEKTALINSLTASIESLEKRVSRLSMTGEGKQVERNKKRKEELQSKVAKLTNKLDLLMDETLES